MCKLFSSKEISQNCYIDHDIVNNKEMIIQVNHDGNWKFHRGKKILEKLLESFKLTKIGWKHKCRMFNYSEKDVWYKTIPGIIAWYK